MRELSVFEAAREAPGRECVVVAGRPYGFAEIADRAAAAIDWLRSVAVSSGDLVAIRPGLDLDSMVWLYALFELGCPALLLHSGLTSAEEQPILNRAKPVLRIDRPPPEPGSGSNVARTQRVVAPVPECRALAIVQTSGSSHAPRSAVLSRGAFVASHAAHAHNIPWRDDDRWLLAMPPAHVGGLSVVTRCLIARRCVVLGPPRFEAASVIATLAAGQISLLSLVPTMLRRLLDAEEPRWAPGPPLRAVLVGGAAFSESMRTEARRRGVPALATYGATEACSQATTQRLDQCGTPGCGPPLRGVRLRIDEGEILLAGPTMMTGYLVDDASANDDVWTDDGWFRTRDAGEIGPDGQLVVHGRLDDVIVSGGENVAPLEVESVLKRVPGVRDACVFGIASEEWGQEVVAMLVVEDAAFDRAAFEYALEARLAPHKRPKRCAIADALPMNHSGKVDRRRAAALFTGLPILAP